MREKVVKYTQTVTNKLSFQLLYGNDNSLNLLSAIYVSCYLETYYNKFDATYLGGRFESQNNQIKAGSLKAANLL